MVNNLSELRKSYSYSRTWIWDLKHFTVICLDMKCLFYQGNHSNTADLGDRAALGLLLDGMAISNPAGGMDICLLCLYIVKSE
jgi:hypothetical protein